MGKDQELLEAARSGNVTVVEKILGQRAKRSGPLARWVSLCSELDTFPRRRLSSLPRLFPRSRPRTITSAFRQFNDLSPISLGIVDVGTRRRLAHSIIEPSPHISCSFRRTPIRVSPIKLSQRYLSSYM